MFRKALLILSGNAFGSLMLLVRNLAVARLVSVEDYGIAATFAVSMAIVEMASGLGLQQLIVQDKDGENPELQAGLQGFNVIRSTLSALVLFLLAHPIARLLSIPDVAWAYQLLALVPLLRGFEHFDIHRLNRAMRFTPLILTKTVPAALSVLCIWPLYAAYGDYRVMLYSVLLHWGLTLITSHLVAERRYWLSFRGAAMRKGLNFGWPLLINNILLFLVFQGDKLLVGWELGMADLAIFSMGVTLTLTPTLVSAASERQFFLPQLSEVRGEPDRFIALARAAMQASLVSGTLLAIAAMLLARPAVDLLLGVKFQPLIGLLPWLALWQALRTFKVGNTIAAMSLGQTANAMAANSVRILFLPVAWHLLAQGGELLQIIWVAMAAELAGYAVSFALLTHRARLDPWPMIPSIFLTLAALSAMVFILLKPPTTLLGTTLGLGGIACCMLLGAAAMRDLRGYLRRKPA